MRFKLRDLVVLPRVALLALIAGASPERIVADDAPFPVRVSMKGRYLEDAGGKPFLLQGDTAWSLMVQLTKEETEEYLENRRQKGFNAILVNLIEHFYADDPPQNKYGDAPFLTAGDFSTPNGAYFAHADWVIDKAREKGILVVLNPCYTGFSSNFKTSGDGWIKATLASGPAKCRNYGRYLGRRYKSRTNIVWQAGGDTTIPVGSDLERNWLELLQGMKEHLPNHLWTAHWYRFSTALDQATFAPSMDVDNAYGGVRTYIQTLRAYNRATPKPTFVNESYYEDTALGIGPVGAPPQMRAKPYWAILSGATGYIFGSDHVWGFGGPRGTPGKPLPRLDWRKGMDRQSSREMVHVRRLFQGRAWYELVPDQDHSVVTSGYGSFGNDDRRAGGDYVTTARTGDGNLVMAYVPPTGNEARTIAVDMKSLNGSANGRWYNPTDGRFATIPGAPFANSGTRTFTTPGDNGTGTNDWVLVLETSPAPSKSPADGVSPAQKTRPAKRSELDEFFRAPPECSNDLGAYRSPLKFDDGGEVRTAEGWQRRRKEILDRWHRIMGPWPPLLERPRIEYLEKQRRENFTQHRVRVEIARGFMCPAILLVPDGQGPFPAAVVPYYDAETGAGLGKELRDFGYQLTRRGFVTLSIGGFEPRRANPEVKEEAGIQRLSYEAYGAANCHTALSSLPEVDAERIGIVGHSYGGKKAMFASCLYDKFACAAWSDGGIVFDEERANVNYWEPWYLGYEPDKQRRKGIPTKDNPRTGAYKALVERGHDLHELHALMAPRPFLVSGGAEDRPGRWKALNHAIAVNRLLGKSDRVAMTNRPGHAPTPESNEQIYLFFERFLKQTR